MWRWPSGHSREQVTDVIESSVRNLMTLKTHCVEELMQLNLFEVKPRSSDEDETRADNPLFKLLHQTNVRTLSHGRFHEHQLFYTGGLQWQEDSNTSLDDVGHESLTTITRLPRTPFEILNPPQKRSYRRINDTGTPTKKGIQEILIRGPLTTSYASSEPPSNRSPNKCNYSPTNRAPISKKGPRRNFDTRPLRASYASHPPVDLMWKFNEVVG
ncbi:hypothetical protein TNCV_2661141 [Trichonephila clavipes]|nr:hypothetical protein TNCV_2661141 [Trichonephila clavipes]